MHSLYQILCQDRQGGPEARNSREGRSRRRRKRLRPVNPVSTLGFGIFHPPRSSWFIVWDLEFWFWDFGIPPFLVRAFYRPNLSIALLVSARACFIRIRHASSSGLITRIVDGR